MEAVRLLEIPQAASIRCPLPGTLLSDPILQRYESVRPQYITKRFFQKLWVPDQLEVATLLFRTCLECVQESRVRVCTLVVTLVSAGPPWFSDDFTQQ